MTFDPGRGRGRTQIALEQAVNAALAGWRVWFVSHDEANSRAHMTRAFEIAHNLTPRTLRCDIARREIVLPAGSIMFIALANSPRGFFAAFALRIAERGPSLSRIILDHHAAYLLDRDERRRAADQRANDETGA